MASPDSFSNPVNFQMALGRIILGVWENLWYSWKGFLNISSLQRNKTNNTISSVLFVFTLLVIHMVLLYLKKLNTALTETL